jgi:uncharacterized membrane protein YccC
MPFVLFFLVIGLLLCMEMAVNSSAQGLEDAVLRMQDILIGCLLSLLTAFILVLIKPRLADINLSKSFAVEYNAPAG